MGYEIKLYDVIGAWGQTAEAFTAAIPQDAEEVTVRINSPGGSVADGLAMYNYLADHPARIVTIVDGYAASAASIVMLAGDEVRVHEGSIVMVHNPWTTTAGNATELRQTAESLDEVGEAMLDIYTRRTGLDRDEIRELLDAETYMRGTVAVERGFASILIEDEEMEPAAAAACRAWTEMLSAVARGDEVMSKQETRKEIEADRDAVRTELAETKSKVEELTGQIETLTQDRDATVALGSDAIADVKAEMTAQLEAVHAQVEELTGQLEARDAALTDATSQIAALTSEGETVRAELDQAKAALADPSLIDAAMIPASVDAAAADAEADKAEEEAQKKADKDAEPKNILEEYEAMEAGPERRKFWNEHKRAILACTTEQE